MSKIVLITFTGENAAGGVPRWVRDFKSIFPEAISYSWQDVLNAGNKDVPCPESDRAQVLAAWLQWKKLVDKDDIIIVDGFWGLGWEDYPNVISVCHGIWSHLTKEEADAGKLPDNPFNHAIQVKYRRNLLERGGRLVAVSEFIQNQMDLQWGFKSTVINNGIDLEKFKPVSETHGLPKPLIIHGINDKGNANKGWSHVRHCMDEFDANFWSLDQAHTKMWTHPGAVDKYYTLALADRVLIPSAFEGFGYFALEAMACDIPVIAYDVGLFYEIAKRKEGFMSNAGNLMSRSLRSKEQTLAALKLSLGVGHNSCYWDHTSSREVANDYSIEKFGENWKLYLAQEFGYG